MRTFLVAAAMFVGSLAFTSNSQANGCYAYTACARSAPIACQTYGDACTWNTIPWLSVQCVGFDVYGRWVNLYFRCL
ncbi:MAG: hypothetical protein HY075_03040 [Deltaproteobacteria bacterium]|nr:hypothetical protein [Deltaproteobacteria bacterium]